MGKSVKPQGKEIGSSGYINEHCWLAKNLGYPPAKRCQYCELNFRNCLFIQYLIISLISIVLVFTLSFLIEGKISKLVVTSFFALIFIYGYFFNRSTEKIIEAYFVQRKAKEALEKLTESLEIQIKERTKELERANEELKNLDEMKSEFVSLASHQLRTPLTSIKGLISMMLEDSWGPLNSDQRKYLVQVYQSEERLLALIENLLDITRIEAGKEEFNLQPVDIFEITKEMVQELIPQTEQKGIYLNITQKKSLPLVKADSLKIRQVIQNLIENAIKYTQKGGVTVAFKKEGDFVIFSVADTGMGVPVAQQPYLFQKFQRGEGKVRYIGGAGLGLYWAAKIITAHGGKIWVSSEGEDKGSTFFFSLPVV